MKKKPWWNDAIQSLHIKIRQKYIQFKSSNFDENYKRELCNAKKEFRNMKRYNMKLKRDKNLRYIES